MKTQLMKKKPKILFIHHATGWGGAPNSLIKLINNLDKSKYDVEVLLLKNSIVNEKLDQFGIRHRIASSRFYKKYYRYFVHIELGAVGYVKWYHLCRFLKLAILWLLSRFYFAKRELAKHDYDIVHLNSSVLTDWLAPAKKGGKVIIHIREPFRKGRFDVLRPVFRSQMRKYADHIIAISKDNARRVNLPDKTTVVYNYAEIPKKEPSENSYASKKVLYLGGFSLIKGFFTMVDALDHLDKDVMVYFGGNYSPNDKQKSIKEKLIHAAKRLVRRKHVAALKKISSHPNAVVIGLTQNVNDYLNEVCCLVSPFSFPHFARPIIEAYLHKKPVIGSDVKGMAEIIEPDKTGFIVPKNNPNKLAEAINDLTSNNQKAKTYGEAGHAIALQMFTPNNIKKIEYVYERILS
jgi:glycosyltransferase involved in cell wall biosynthesis